MGLNCSLHVNEPIMSGTLSCDKGGFNGVERFPRVSSKCPNNAMKTLLVYLLMTTQPRFSKLVSATQYATFPVEVAHNKWPVLQPEDENLQVHVTTLLGALNMVFLTLSCSFTSTLLYLVVILALISIKSSGCLSTKCCKTPPQPMCHCDSSEVGWRLISCRSGPYLTAP